MLDLHDLDCWMTNEAKEEKIQNINQLLGFDVSIISSDDQINLFETVIQALKDPRIEQNFTENGSEAFALATQYGLDEQLDWLWSLTKDDFTIKQRLLNPPSRSILAIAITSGHLETAQKIWGYSECLDSDQRLQMLTGMFTTMARSPSWITDLARDDLFYKTDRYGMVIEWLLSLPKSLEVPTSLQKKIQAGMLYATFSQDSGPFGLIAIAVKTKHQAAFDMLYHAAEELRLIDDMLKPADEWGPYQLIRAAAYHGNVPAFKHLVTAAKERGYLKSVLGLGLLIDAERNPSPQFAAILRRDPDDPDSASELAQSTLAKLVVNEEGMAFLWKMADEANLTQQLVDILLSPSGDSYDESLTPQVHAIGKRYAAIIAIEDPLSFKSTLGPLNAEQCISAMNARLHSKLKVAQTTLPWPNPFDLYLDSETDTAREAFIEAFKTQYSLLGTQIKFHFFKSKFRPTLDEDDTQRKKPLKDQLLEILFHAMEKPNSRTAEALRTMAAPAECMQVIPSSQAPQAAHAAQAPQ